MPTTIFPSRESSVFEISVPRPESFYVSAMVTSLPNSAAVFALGHGEGESQLLVELDFHSGRTRVVTSLLDEKRLVASSSTNALLASSSSLWSVDLSSGETQRLYEAGGTRKLLAGGLNGDEVWVLVGGGGDQTSLLEWSATNDSMREHITETSFGFSDVRRVLAAADSNTFAADVRLPSGERQIVVFESEHPGYRALPIPAEPPVGGGAHIFDFFWCGGRLCTLVNGAKPGEFVVRLYSSDARAIADLDVARASGFDEGLVFAATDRWIAYSTLLRPREWSVGILDIDTGEGRILAGRYSSIPNLELSGGDLLIGSSSTPPRVGLVRLE